MDAIERLTRLFERFPGIGPRQASRFVAYLLRSTPATRKELISALQDLGNGVRKCDTCMRYHSGDGSTCSLCSDPKRDTGSLMIVASDSDLVAIERSGTYRGGYFVLGGTISLASEKPTNLRLKELQSLASSRHEQGSTELILALPANPEGDATSLRVRDELSEKIPGVRITTLGRGLSTGSEIEYADPETIKSALENRR